MYIYIYVHTYMLVINMCVRNVRRESITNIIEACLRQIMYYRAFVEDTWQVVQYSLEDRRLSEGVDEDLHQACQVQPIELLGGL